MQVHQLNGYGYLFDYGGDGYKIRGDVTVMVIVRQL